MTTKELVTGDIEDSMKKIDGAYSLIEEGFRFLRESKIEADEELIQRYKALDEKTGLQRSVIARELYGENN